MKALCLILLLCYSCSKKADFSKDAVGVHIQPVKMEVSHLNEVEWSVGKNKEEKVSQSLTFIVDMPKVKQEALDYLTEQKGIDSWILRMISVKGSETQDLGSLYALFKPRLRSRTSQGGVATASVTLKVFYAAAYASERFRSFKCPAFGHVKKIKSMDIVGENEDFTISITQTFAYNEKGHLVELTPSAFNGGHSLVGDYYLEIAAYDSKKRIVHSAFKRLPMSIKVRAEDSIRVPSCDGVRQEIQ